MRINTKRSLYPTFKQFIRINNWWNRKNKKPNNPTWVLVVYYPLIIFSIFWIHVLILMLFIHLRASMEKSERVSYRKSPQYKKVIKEGLLWDSVEYHER